MRPTTRILAVRTGRACVGGLTSAGLIALALLGACTPADGRKELPADGATGWTDADFVRGSLQGRIEQPLPQVFDATKAAMGDLGLIDIEGSIEPSRGRLSARTTDGERIRVDLSPAETGTATVLSIRFGTIGDESRSRELLAKVRGRGGAGGVGGTGG
jgi:hypothetical protein